MTISFKNLEEFNIQVIQVLCESVEYNIFFDTFFFLTHSLSKWDFTVVMSHVLGNVEKLEHSLYAQGIAEYNLFSVMAGNNCKLEIRLILFIINYRNIVS